MSADSMKFEISLESHGILYVDLASGMCLITGLTSRNLIRTG